MLKVLEFCIDKLGICIVVPALVCACKPYKHIGEC